MDFLGFLSSHKMGTKCICGCFVFLGFTQNGYWVLTVCVIQLFLVFTQNGTNPSLSNSISLSLYVQEFCWESCLLILKSVVKERQKKEKKKGSLFGGVCIQQILCFLQQQLQLGCL